MERSQHRHTAGAPQHNQTTNEQECPICISQPHFAIKTNCGHLFCGKTVNGNMQKLMDNQLGPLQIAKTEN